MSRLRERKRAREKRQRWRRREMKRRERELPASQGIVSQTALDLVGKRFGDTSWFEVPSKGYTAEEIGRMAKRAMREKNKGVEDMARELEYFPSGWARVWERIKKFLKRGG